ncbi:MAG: hypothetical protein V1787_02670 [Candidatus Micrarchaeota archaeon]
MKPATAAVLFALAAVFLAHQYYGLPVTSDAAELARQSAHMTSHQTVLVPSTSVGAGLAQYPPAFAILLAETSLLTGADAFLSLNILSYAFALALVLSTVLLTRRMGCGETESWIAGASVVFMPLLFYRAVTPIAETLGLVLFALAVSAFDSGRYRLAGFLLLALPFSHFRSFAVAASAVLALGLFSGRLKAAIAVIALPTVLFVLMVPLSALGLQNPWVTVLPPEGVLGWLVLSAAVLGAAHSLVVRREGADDVTKSVISAFALTSLAAPFAFRQLAYLFPVAAKFTARLASVDVRVAMSFLVLGSLAVVQAAEYRSPPFIHCEIAAFGALDSFDGAVVLAPFRESNILPLYASKKVVVGAFAESVPQAGERLQDTWSYYYRAGGAERTALAGKYGVSLVVDSPHVDRGYSAKLLDSGGTAVFRPD